MTSAVDTSNVADSLRRLRIGYAPSSPDLSSPNDRRRFSFYAQARELEFEIADPRREYDIVVVGARADITVWARYPAGRIIYELVDAYLAAPKYSPKSLLRGPVKFALREIRWPSLAYGSAIERMCRRSAAVLCSTSEQRGDLLRICDNVHVIGDNHDYLIRTIKTDYHLRRVLRLVWEGLPGNVGQLRGIASALQVLEPTTPIALHVVTDLQMKRWGGRYGTQDTLATVRSIFRNAYVHEWKAETLSQEITACDVAIIPLDLHDPFVAAKSDNKLFLLWRMGMPTVASATPAYDRAMRQCSLDLTCRSQDDWIRVLRGIASDQTAREAAGMRGRAFAEAARSPETLLAAWDRMFASIL